MDIRKKTTLWVSIVAVMGTIVFSSIVFIKMFKQLFLFVDKELLRISTAIYIELEQKGANADIVRLSTNTLRLDDYWIQVQGSDGASLYHSRITSFVDIPERLKAAYVFEAKISQDKIWLGQDEHDEVFFRVRTFHKEINGEEIRVCIAKPIEAIEEESVSLMVFLGVGLCLFVLIIVYVSYQLAGKILAPIQTINRLSQEISEQSLDKRIPLGESRDELYVLSKSLNTMFDRLQYSFERQKEFIGNASHELKSPITLLLLSQEELLAEENLPEKVEHSLTRQVEITRRLRQLIKNLLDLSRLEQQEILHRERVDIAEVIGDILEQYDGVLATHSMTIEKDVYQNLSVYGDLDKLTRLFINLIDNAIRYNLPQNGSIDIKGYRRGENSIVELVNTGTPLAEQDLTKIFEQFYRVEKSRALVYGGSGLGLTIVKKIVDLHDGRIWFENIGADAIKVTVVLPSA